MKILFLNNFSLMTSIKEELIMQIMWIITFFLVASMIQVSLSAQKAFLFQVTVSWMDCINVTWGSGKSAQDHTLLIFLGRSDI